MSSSAKNRRVILLLGAPRSGTSWLANILNSHPGVLYSHEPLTKLGLPHLEPIFQRLTREGELTAEERRTLLSEWIRAYPIHRRPPFFPKSFQAAPPTLMKWAWAPLRPYRTTQALFRHLFSPSESKRFDLLVKEVGWPVQAGNIVRGLDAELIVLVRHPCAVVASELKGIAKGLMLVKDRDQWLRDLGPAIAELGFSETDVRSFPEFEWLTVCWMVSNRIYQRIVAEHDRSQVVVYEDLCRDPIEATPNIFAALGWEMGPQTLAFLDQSTHVKSSLMTMLLGNQPYFGIYRETAEAADKWKTALPPAQRDRVLELVRPFFPEFVEQDERETSRAPLVVASRAEEGYG